MAAQRAGTPPASPNIEDVKNVIHCILCSNKEVVTPEQLLKDYVTLCGSALPFRELGYSSVIDLLKAVPDVVSVGFVNGTVVVRAVPKNTSAHIAKLVAGQKKAKRAAKLPRPLNNNFKQAFQSAIRSQAPHFNVANNAGHAPWNNNFIPPPARRADAPLYHVFRAMQPAAQTQRQQAAQPPKPMQSAAPAHPSKPMQSAAPAHPSKPVPTSTPAHEFRPMQPALTQAQQAQQVKPLPSVPHKPGVQKWTVVQPGPVSPALQQLSYSNHTSPTSLKGQQAKTSISPENIRSKLARFVKLHQLGEISYSSSRMKNGQYVGTVSFANSKIKGNSYPDTFPKEEDAFEKAAEEALGELEAWYEASVVNLPITTDKQLLAKRVVDMVSKIPSGCWSAAFPKVYADEYREKLPKDWIAQVQSATDLLEFEPAKPTEHFIITLTRPKTPSPIPPVIEVSASVAPKTPVETTPVPIPAQHIDCDIWTVHVHSILTGSQVGIRRVDCEENTEWDNLMNEIELHYGPSKPRPVDSESLKRGTLYATKIDGMWFRAEFIAFVDENKATVSLVDYVDTEEVLVNEIYPLEARFAQLPCQGIVCQLHGLTAFSSSEIAISAVSKRLVNQQFAAQIISRDPQISVVLSESSSGKELNLNELILEQCAEEAEPTPLKLGAVTQSSVISYVSPRCDIFLLRDTPQQNAVDALVSMVAMRVDDSPAAYDLIADNLYLGKSERHDWCRMRLLCSVATAEGKVVVQLVDFGDTEAVSSSTLRDLQVLSPVLAKIPGQAVKVVLARVPPPGKTFNEKAFEVLRNITPAEVNVLVRVIEFSSGGHPVVELFERLSDGKIVTINGSLEMNDSIYKAIEISPARASPTLSSIPRSGELSQRMGALSLSSRQSTGSSSSPVDSEQISATVPAADIPPVDKDHAGKPFQVHVLNASNPHHFYVQSTLTSQALSALTRRMQELFVKDNASALDSKAVVEGGFYGAMHAKTKSYRRVQVTRKLGSDCQVVFVDYGDMDVVAANSLKPLHEELAELPAQAIRAKLHGVKPKDGDWSPLDVFFFQKVAGDKVLSAFIIDVLPDNTIALELIESVEGQDQSIANLLIDNSHATSA